MKQEATYAALHVLVQDMEYQSKKSPAFAFINREKIKRFFQLNGIRISAMNKAQDEMIEKFTAKDEEGKPLTQTNEETKKLEYVYTSDEMKAEHTKEFEAFMGRTIDIML